MHKYTGSEDPLQAGGREVRTRDVSRDSGEELSTGFGGVSPRARTRSTEVAGGATLDAVPSDETGPIEGSRFVQLV